MSKFLKIFIIVAIIALICVFAVPRVSKLIVDAVAPNGGDYYDDAIENLEDGLTGHANGGFDFDDLQNQLNDTNAPIVDDQIFDIYIYECPVGVVFYYQTVDENGDIIYPNIFFKKSGDYIFLDGIANTYLSVPYKKGFLGIGATYDFSEANLDVDFSKNPKYEFSYELSLFNESEYQNIASMSDGKVLYWKNYAHNRCFVNPSDTEVNKCANLVSDKLLEVLTTYFTKIGDFEIISEELRGNSILMKINSIFNFIYKQVYDGKTNTSKVVDVSNFFVYLIADDERINYPIPEDQLSEYEEEYYFAYICKIYFYVEYKYEGVVYLKNTKFEADADFEEYPEPAVEYVKLNVALLNVNGANLQTIDIVNYPVTINFSSNGDYVTSVKFNSVSDLGVYLPVILEKNKSFNYEIDSSILLFESLSGSVQISGNTSKLLLKYSYIPDTLILNVGLNLIGDTDLSELDLWENPVAITFSNGQTVYFDTNEKLTQLQTLLVALDTGTTEIDLTYTILSEQLLFASTTGTIHVSAEQRVHYFNCALETSTAVELSCDSVTSLYFPSSSGGYTDDKVIHIDVSSTDYERLNDYTMAVYLYDGETMYTLSSYAANPLVGTTSGRAYIFELPSDFISTGYPTEELPYYYNLQVTVSDGTNTYVSNLCQICSAKSTSDDLYRVSCVDMVLNF